MPSGAKRAGSTGRRAGSQCRGFTLLEVLVALIIATSASAIILTHLRVLIDLSDRIRRHQTETSQLLNEAARLASPDWSTSSAHRLRADDVAITLKDEIDPSIFVRNFDLHDEVGPPAIDRAYTPYQVYRVQRGKRRAIHLLYPNLSLGY